MTCAECTEILDPTNGPSFYWCSQECQLNWQRKQDIYPLPEPPRIPGFSLLGRS